jgi:hypothetical protein
MTSHLRWDFFIAHTGKDKSAAEALFDYLDPHYRVFLDSRCLRLGEDWDSQLRVAQKESAVTLVLVSEDTESAYYQREEIAAAIDLARVADGHRVVPIFIGTETLPTNVPYGLRLKHGLFVSPDVAWDELAQTLSSSLRGALVMSPTAIAERLRCRAPLARAVRLIPKSDFDPSGSLGTASREYVFVGDYEEQRHRTLGDVLSNLWIGDAFDAVVNSNVEWVALNFEVGELNRRKLDVLPATWKSAFRILSDPRRAACFAASDVERESLGASPRDYYSDDQLYWYNRLTIDERRYAEEAPDYYLYAKLGIDWLCYLGDGITARGPNASGVPSRVFFVRNVPLDTLSFESQDLGHPNEARVLA